MRRKKKGEVKKEKKKQVKTKSKEQNIFNEL